MTEVTHVHLLERLVKGEVEMQQVQKEMGKMQVDLHDIKNVIYENRDIGFKITTQLKLIGWILVVLLPAMTAVGASLFLINGTN